MVADPEADLRVTVGGRAVRTALLRVGAQHLRDELRRAGQAAVRAMNQGAKAGGFAHDTGEGGLSRYHKEAGGDLIWQIGTGYFGCRDAERGLRPGGLPRRPPRCPRSR